MQTYEANINGKYGELGIAHLAANAEAYEPMRDNNFEFIVHFPSTLVAPGIDALDANPEVIDSNQAQEIIRFSAHRVQIPNYTQGVISVKRGNMEMKAAGTITFGEGTLEVVDYIGADSKPILLAWQRLVGDPLTEAVGRMVNYKMKAELVEYTPDFEQVRYWDVYGAWPSSVSDNGVTNEGGNAIRTMSATIQFDKAIMHLP